MKLTPQDEENLVDALRIILTLASILMCACGIAIFLTVLKTVFIYFGIDIGL